MTKVVLLFFLKFLDLSAARVASVEYKKNIESLINREKEYVKRTESFYFEKLCISLGFNCVTALQLEYYKLRQRSFPFDWNITSFQGLYQTIDNQFTDFLDPKCLSCKEELRCMPGVINLKYNIVFAHDFPQTNGVTLNNYMDYLPEIHEMYFRRIKRFYNACNMAKEVYFFRTQFCHWPLYSEIEDKKNIEKLRDILIKKFPLDNWILIAIGNDEIYKEDWMISKVKNFYMSQSGIMHQSGAGEEWLSIFKILSLID